MEIQRLALEKPLWAGPCSHVRNGFFYMLINDPPQFRLGLAIDLGQVSFRKGSPASNQAFVFCLSAAEHSPFQQLKTL